MRTEKGERGPSTVTLAVFVRKRGKASLIELLPAYALRQPHLNKTKRLKRQENIVITLNKGVPMALYRPGGESNSL